jgi:hypothetical protein
LKTVSAKGSAVNTLLKQGANEMKN